jgi:hypothetical protein
MTLSTVGKVLLAVGIIVVHVRMAKERRIDEEVIESFQTEFYITLCGLFCIICGYLLEVYALGALDTFFSV